MTLHKTSIELREELIVACGIYCGWCPYYILGTKEFKCGECWTWEKCEIRDRAANKDIKICTFCHESPCLNSMICIIE